MASQKRKEYVVKLLLEMTPAYICEANRILAEYFRLPISLYQTRCYTDGREARVVIGCDDDEISPVSELAMKFNFEMWVGYLLHSRPLGRIWRLYHPKAPDPTERRDFIPFSLASFSFLKKSIIAPFCDYIERFYLGHIFFRADENGTVLSLSNLLASQYFLYSISLFFPKTPTHIEFDFRFKDLHIQRVLPINSDKLREVFAQAINAAELNNV